MKQHDFINTNVPIPVAEFRRELTYILNQSMDFDDIMSILDYEIGNKTVFELIKSDVEECSAWRDEGYYSDSDIKLAFGRIVLELLEAL